MTHVQCKNVHFSRGITEIIHGISFEIKKGEFVALTGENGAGKSTLANLIGGLLKPDGTPKKIKQILKDENGIFLNGENINALRISSLASKRGFLFQNPDRQICKNTVKEEIEFSLTCIGINGEELENRRNEVLKEFNFTGNEVPFLLRRGQRQRLALALVIDVAPPLLILDEPTTGLDYRECTSIMNKIKKLNKNGTTVIMICHDMELVLDYAKRMIVMANGNIIADGKTKDILHNEIILKEASLRMPQITAVAKKLGSAFDGLNFSHELVAKFCELTSSKEFLISRGEKWLVY